MISDWSEGIPGLEWSLEKNKDKKDKDKKSKKKCCEKWKKGKRCKDCPLR